MDMEEKTLTKKYVFEGKILNMRKDTAEMPDGLVVDREVVEHPGGVGIALEDEEGRFFFVRQWRYAQGEETLEFPAGKKEAGEDPMTTAQREIIEETGYEGKDWVYLGKMYPTPAYDTEVVTFYYAKKGDFKGQHLDRDEYINLECYTLDEMIAKSVAGEVPDAKTMSMLLLIQAKKERGEL